MKAARKCGCEIVTYEWLTDTFQLWDYQKRRAPPSLYDPGKTRDGEAISDLFRKSEKKAKAVKKATPVAAGTTAVDGDEEAVGTGVEHLTLSEKKKLPEMFEEGVPQKISGEKDHQKVSGAGESKDTKVVDEMKGASMPVNRESGKPIEQPEAKDQEPPVDLSLYAICKDELGHHQIEVWKPDSHGNARGCRLVLELYESKSEPKTYLFSARKYPTAGSSSCIWRFPSEAPGDKKHEFEKYKASFRKCTHVDWSQRDSMPSHGPFCYRKKMGSAGHKHKFDQLGERKERSPRGAVAVPHKRRDDDRETSYKRKRSFSEERPAKAFKVTKPSVTRDSAKATNGGSKAV